MVGTGDGWERPPIPVPYASSAEPQHAAGHEAAAAQEQDSEGAPGPTDLRSGRQVRADVADTLGIPPQRAVA
jgi:hypothetical protein